MDRSASPPSPPSPARVPPPPPSPRRPVLAPGVHVLRRSADALQVGLDPARALVLPDTSRSRTLLAALTSPGSAAPEAYDARTTAFLEQAGLVVDADTLMPLVPSGPGSEAPTTRAGVAAVASRHGAATAAVLAARRAARVEVASCGSPEARRLAEELRTLLGAAGLTVHEDERGRGPGPTDPPQAVAVVCVGEPSRDLVDGWMRRGVPHLLLRLTEGSAVVGPFVRPGETACLRCVDAHHTDVDPSWPLLVLQYAAAVRREREDALPEPVDPLLATLATAWCAKEVVTWVEGRAPATTSTTIRLDADLSALETQVWPRHPGCGCAGL